MRRGAEVRFATVCLVILIAFIVLPVLVRAVDYNVGVKVGDWIKYGQFKVTWSGNGTEPSYITDEKKVDWLRIDVENISGTTVTLNTTIHYNNGTQIPQGSSVDVTGGAGMPGISLLIASNLKRGDPVTNQTNSPYDKSNNHRNIRWCQQKRQFARVYISLSQSNHNGHNLLGSKHRSHG